MGAGINFEGDDMRLKIILTGIIFLLCSCANSLVVTGEALKGIGNQFVEVSAVYKGGCDVTKVIAPSTCAEYRQFGEKFQKVFPLNVKLWEAARSANDVASQDKISSVIADLAASLSAFSISVIQTFGGK